jgi:tripartite-type tricarboxylate transporter receptor subunit TctC
MNGWFALVAPARTPVDVVARLNRYVGDYLDGPDIQQRLLAFGLATEGAGTPAGTGQRIRDEQDIWRGLAKELQIEPQ